MNEGGLAMSHSMEAVRSQRAMIEGKFRAQSEAPVSHFPRWMKIGFWVCIVIAVAAVLRRAVTLVAPLSSSSAPPQLVNMDRYFAAHAGLTWTHILCAGALVLLLPFLFWSRTRGSALFEQMFFVLGFVVGATAYGMSVYAVGGWLERSAVLVFNTLYLASLARAFVYSRRRENALKEKWLIRAVAILLGIATTRPVMGVFFATARLTHLTPHQFFGIAFWVGFSINTIVIELWLRRAAERTLL